MSEQLENKEEPEAPEVESAQAPEPADLSEPQGNYPLTPRMRAIALGEDPDAVTDEPEAEQVEEAVDDNPAEEVAEAAPAAPSEPTSWVTDADRQLATAYGLDAEDLAAIGSREELGRTFRSIDKANSRRQPADFANLRTPEPAKKDEGPVDDTKPVGPDGKLNLAYYEKNFDEGTVEAMKLVRAQQDALEELKTSQAEYQKQVKEQQEQAFFNQMVVDFNKAADVLLPEFLGATVDKSGLPTPLTAEQQTRRQQLFDSANLIADHMAFTQEQQGLPISIPPWPQLLEQASQLRFPEELAKQRQAKETATREEQLKKVAKQSQRRRPVAESVGDRTAYRNAPPSDPHSTESIMQNPAVANLLRSFREGVA